MKDEITAYRQAIAAQATAREEYNKAQTDETFDAWLDTVEATNDAWRAITDKEKPTDDERNQ